MGNAILGTLMLIAEACAVGLPIGLFAGIYLAEVGRGRLASVVRFTADVLAGVPSISIGVFVYATVVVAMGRFSAFAGGLALGVIMIPTVTRTTEELLRLVPSHLREAALGLGVPAWRTTLFVVVRTAAPGIATGVMLAIARVAGETAPLLFTAFSSRYWSAAVDRPVASLPVQILTYATSPYEEWHRQAWAGALVLVALIFTLNVGARLVSRRLGEKA
jgi:phosphate transport system permease protein